MRKSALPPIVHNDSRILILGTMPGERSIALQQYYANRGNRFWKILFEVFDREFSQEYDIRIKLLKENKIALWNVLSSCERHGSQDNNIKNERANDIDGFLVKYPEIKFIFFESKSAERFFDKHLTRKSTISYITLPSTSGLNAGVPFDEKLAQWRELRRVFS